MLKKKINIVVVAVVYGFLLSGVICFAEEQSKIEDTEIVFYGKVVDQYYNPVADVNVNVPPRSAEVTPSVLLICRSAEIPLTIPNDVTRPSALIAIASVASPTTNDVVNVLACAKAIVGKPPPLTPVM